MTILSLSKSLVCRQQEAEWARWWLSGREPLDQPPLAAVGPRTPTCHLLAPKLVSLVSHAVQMSCLDLDIPALDGNMVVALS